MGRGGGVVLWEFRVGFLPRYRRVTTIVVTELIEYQ